MARFPPDSTLDRCGVQGVAELRALWIESSHAAGTTIVTAEEEDDDVFFVLEGRARAATYTDAGREVRLSDLTPGEGFGIFAALDGRPRSTNVVAVDDTRCARITGAAFRDVLNRVPEVSNAFLVYLVERLRAMSEKMTALTTQSAEERLIRTLLDLARPLPERVAAALPGNAGDAAFIAPIPTQQELAGMIVSQREAVGREMSALARRGLVRRPDRKSLVIPSLSRLRAAIEER